MTSPLSFTNDQEGASASDLLRESGSRRSFLRRSALGIAIAAPVGLLAGCGGTTPPAAETTPTSNPMLSLPALANNAETKTAFTDIQNHEIAHVNFLKTALGKAARPAPTFKPLLQSDITKFAATAKVLENVGVGAYLFGAGAITTKAYLIAAAEILTVEARHAGYLDVLTGNPISPSGSMDKPLTQKEIVDAAGPFIANLNGGSDPAATLKNDVDILNFALLLEYLEAAYYTANVPHFFP